MSELGTVVRLSCSSELFHPSPLAAIRSSARRGESQLDAPSFGEGRGRGRTSWAGAKAEINVLELSSHRARSAVGEERVEDEPHEQRANLE